MAKGEAGVIITIPLTSAIASVWKKIREINPEVPVVVLTIGSGTLGAKKGTVNLGHFAANRWEHNSSTRYPELFVGGEGLAQGAEELLGTLLHEAAHGVAVVRKIQDTSSQGRYHNEKYRKIATEMGLNVEKTGNIGWSKTSMAEGVIDQYKDSLELLRKALVAFRLHEGTARSGGSEEGEEGEEKKSSNNVKCTCECIPKPRIIRVSKSVLELGGIECRTCGEDFEPADS
jgi:hypothetical protein